MALICVKLSDAQQQIPNPLNSTNPRASFTLYALEAVLSELNQLFAEKPKVKQKFIQTIRRMEQRLFVDDYFEKEFDPGNHCPKVYALKVFAQQLNTRIYCVIVDGNHIVMIHLLRHKNTQHVPKHLQKKLEQLACQQFELQP